MTYLAAPSHVSVMKNEVLEWFNVAEGTYVDCTFGSGGHSKAILQHNPKAKIIAFDRDELALQFAQPMQDEFAGRFIFYRALFSEISSKIDSESEKIAGILYDIGVSSMQIDSAERGFSFQHDGPLDMRMGICDFSAHDIVNSWSEKMIADIIFQYGDERYSRRIAAAIVEYREKNSINTTLELAEIIKNAIPYKGYSAIHPATKTFQALRIVVNTELQELEKSLHRSIEILPSDGKLCVITFHSLEDRIVKNVLKHYASEQKPKTNRHDPAILATKEWNFEPTLILSKPSPITASDSEIKKNIRARSAKMRCATKI